MSPGDYVALGAAFFCLLGAAFFGAAETAFSRLSLVRALRMTEEQPGAERVVTLMRDPVRTINISALLVLVFEVTAAAIAAVLAVRHIDNGFAVAAAVFVAACLLFVGAEVTPRTLALQRTERVALRTARWVSLAATLLTPVASVLVRIGDLIAPGGRLATGPFVTADELREMIDVAESDEVIEQSERAMLRGVFDLGETVVREIMVPRPDMVVVSDEQTLEEVVDVVLSAGHSRVPVYSGDRDRIAGLIYAKDLLLRLHSGPDDEPWTSLLRTPHFVPELASVDQLLRDLQTQQVHLAIVVDEYGGIAGLVTIEDILEEIVGEIVDEYDLEEPLVEALSDDTWRVDARFPVEELNELLGTDLPAEEWDSVGGLFIGALGRVPDEAEQVKVEPVRLTAQRVEGRRILTVLVERVEPAEESSDDVSVSRS
jgi:CBS domain containing-hemolysin-like protein